MKYTIKQAQELVDTIGPEAAALVLKCATVVDDDGNTVEFKIKKQEQAPAAIDTAEIVKQVTKAVTDSFEKAAPRITGGDFRNDDQKKLGWRDAGEFAAAVIAHVKGVKSDERLKSSIPRHVKASLSTYVNEGVGEEGGFAVPPEFAATIQNKIEQTESLASRCNNITTGRNTYVYTKDETTPWQSTGGIIAYWDGEADAISQSKVKLKQDILRLNKLTALVPITDEAAEDAPSLIQHINVKAPQKMAFKLDLAILQGTGAGQPRGIIDAPCTVSVGKVGSQVADTLVALNLLNMLNRLYAKSRATAVFVAHQDTEVQLQTLMKLGRLDTGATDTGWGITVPFFTYDANGMPRLAGKPVIFHEACETVGDKGDIFLADFSQYDLVTKTGGITSAESMHLWFDQSTTALRFVMRAAGQPSWSSTIAARDGSTTYSPFVTLDERA